MPRVQPRRCRNAMCGVARIVRLLRDPADRKHVLPRAHRDDARRSALFEHAHVAVVRQDLAASAPSPRRARRRRARGAAISTVLRVTVTRAACPSTAGRNARRGGIAPASASTQRRRRRRESARAAPRRGARAAARRRAARRSRTAAAATRRRSRASARTPRTRPLRARGSRSAATIASAARSAPVSARKTPWPVNGSRKPAASPTSSAPGALGAAHVVRERAHRHARAEPRRARERAHAAAERVRGAADAGVDVARPLREPSFGTTTITLARSRESGLSAKYAPPPTYISTCSSNAPKPS